MASCPLLSPHLHVYHPTLTAQFDYEGSTPRKVHVEVRAGCAWLAMHA